VSGRRPVLFRPFGQEGEVLLTSLPYVDPAVYNSSALTRNLSSWLLYLADDRDRDFIIDGLAVGFRILPANYDFTLPDPSFCTNYSSATTDPAKPFLDDLFLQELAEGKLSIQSSAPRRINAIGAVPKKGSDSFRPITDCSRPLTNSLNSYIRPHVESFRLKTIDDAVAAMSPGCFMAIADLQAAYRSAPVFPLHRQLLGFLWQFPGDDHQSFVVDNVLNFGMSISPSIFNRLSTAVVRILYRSREAGLISFTAVVVYLDDFCIVAHSQTDCDHTLRYLISLVEELGFRISAPKVVWPSQQVRFLGIDLDSVLMQLSLPADKLSELQSTAADFIRRDKVSKLQLQQFAGLANFAAKVVRGARTFSRRIIDAGNSLSEPHHRTRVTLSLRADLEWWIKFGAWFNGSAAIIRDDRLWAPRLVIQTDACLSGWGAVSSGLWLAGTWQGAPDPANLSFLESSPQWSSATPVPASVAGNINYLELFAVVLAARKWAPRWRNRRIIVQSDNTQAVACLNKGSSTNPLSTALLRELFWLSVLHNFHLTASHLPGAQNPIADQLSRLSDARQIGQIIAGPASSP